jgi:hypothetical protein
MVAPHSPETQFGPTWPGQRCLAKTRRGTACQKPALKSKARCQLHGGRSTGAPRGAAHGRYVDGQHTASAKAERRAKSEAVRRGRKRLQLAIRMARMLHMYPDQKPLKRAVDVDKFFDLKDQYDALLEPV